DWLEVKRIIKIGLPLGIEMFLRIASFLIFSALIGAVGDRQLAASQICIQIIRFSFMPGYGLAVATTALVGKYIGAKNINAATKSVKSSLAIGAIYASALAVILLTLAQPIVGLFNTDPTVVAICRRIMFLAAFLQFFDIIAIVASGALRGAGDTKWIMKATLYGSWLVGLPIAIFFCAFIKLGAFGAWIGLTSETLFLATIFYLRFYKGKWKEIRL
ncbi:hypothetical protein KKF63_09820, partial [bacterium]|nr:hypothetical protein [bacterium]